ncbi:MAG: hypothetical protein OEW39_12740 [Deltaproteobacteria bacterium]|nr:hypothetical protein [Deltaproteobacteria bacterium]
MKHTQTTKGVTGCPPAQQGPLEPCQGVPLCRESSFVPLAAGTPRPGLWTVPLTRRQAFGLAVLTLLTPARKTRAAGPVPGPFRFLQAESASLFASWAGILLNPILPLEPAPRALRIAEVVRSVDALAANLPPGVRGELLQVVDLLGLAPTRFLLTGLWSAWEEASPQHTRGALESLSQSRFGLKRRIYQALHLLIGSAGFGSEQSWATLSYPGPPQVPRPPRPWELP